MTSRPGRAPTKSEPYWNAVTARWSAVRQREYVEPNIVLPVTYPKPQFKPTWDRSKGKWVSSKPNTMQPERAKHWNERGFWILRKVGRPPHGVNGQPKKFDERLGWLHCTPTFGWIDGVNVWDAIAGAWVAKGTRPRCGAPKANKKKAKKKSGSGSGSGSGSSSSGSSPKKACKAAAAKLAHPTSSTTKPFNLGPDGLLAGDGVGQRYARIAFEDGSEIRGWVGPAKLGDEHQLEGHRIRIGISVQADGRCVPQVFWKIRGKKKRAKDDMYYSGDAWKELCAQAAGCAANAVVYLPTNRDGVLGALKRPLAATVRRKRSRQEEAAAAAAAEPSADNDADDDFNLDRPREEEEDAAAGVAAAAAASATPSATPSVAPAPKRARSQSSSSSSSALTCRERVARLEKECGLAGLHNGILISRIVSLEGSLEIAPLAASGLVRRIRALEEKIG